MNPEFDAIYERGVFRPLERIDLPEQTKVHLQIQARVVDATASLAHDASAQKAALHALLNWVDSRPSLSADERFAARDHDRLLYGWQK